MKRLCLVTLLFGVFTACACHAAIQAAMTAPLPESSQEQKDIACLLDLLGDLAAERYAANSNRNETWILTVHVGHSIRKYTDGKYTVLSLPASKQEARGAICSYVNQYNSLNLRAADLLVRSGKYDEARNLLQLIDHFGCQGSHTNQEAKKRLPYLAKLVAGEDPEPIVEQLRNLYVDYRSPLDFTQIDRSASKVVPNLLEIDK